MPRAWASAVLVAVGLLTAHIVFDDVFADLRGKTFDIYQMLFPAPPVTSPIVLVEIDERSLAEYGRWPWNRGRFADLLEAVAKNGATAIGIDVLFPEPDLNPGGPEGDQKFAAVLSRTPSVLSATIGEVPSAGGAVPKSGWSLVGDIPENLPSVPGVLTSLPIFDNAAKGTGIIRATPDADSTLREMPLLWIQSSSDGINIWPSLALELLRLHLSADSFAARMSEGGFQALKVGDLIVQLSAYGTILLRERTGSLQSISAAELIAGNHAPALNGAIAIIALNAIGLDKFHKTPGQISRFGAEVHGMVIDQLMTGDLPVEPAHARNLERFWFAAGTLLILLLSALPTGFKWITVPLMALIVASPFIAALAAFAQFSLFYEGLQPAGALLLVTVTSAYANYRIAEERRQVLQEQFSMFLSPEIVRRLARGDMVALIAVEKREITALIMDIRGFTALTHTLEASEIVSVINHFLGIATDEILKRDGTIDKFIGDAVLAIWNAPVETPGHADSAIDAAEAIIDRVAAENIQLTKMGLPELKVGAGLETGICSVGNYGTTRRIDYTAIGDAINLAARLESATKITKIGLLAGPGFAQSTTRCMRSIGKLKLSGFDEEVEAFTLQSSKIPAE